MKVIIELYDKEPVENILSSCIFAPDMVVFLCDGKDNSLRKEQAVYRLFQSRNSKTKPRFYYIDTTNPKLIQRALQAIARDYPGCVFDFSGGKDLVLLTAGVFCAEQNLPAFYIDIEHGRFINLRGCDTWEAQFAMPKFTAEDIFALAGAKLVGNGHFSTEQIDDAFTKDVNAVWPLVLQNPSKWNAMASFFQAASARKPENDLSVSVDQTIRVNQQTTARADTGLLRQLAQQNIVKDLQIQEGAICFTHKSALMKQCLQNHGIWLELHAFLQAKQSGKFDDVRTSVLVDWDGSAGAGPNTRNEIDVLLVQGITPVFISCKMGFPTPLALSEIKILSEKFGGARTKTMLLTAAPVRKDSPAVAQRAKDLDIVLWDKTDLQQPQLAQRLYNSSKQ